MLERMRRAAVKVIAASAKMSYANIPTGVKQKLDNSIFLGRHMTINRIGGHASIPLKFKLVVFLFCLTHRVATKVSHSAAVSNANDCSHSVIDSRKFSVGLCIKSNPHATMRKNFKHKNPLLMSQRIITGVEWGTREPPL